MATRTAWRLGALGAALVVAAGGGACSGSSGGEGADSGADAGAGAGADSGADSGAGADAGADSGHGRDHDAGAGDAGVDGLADGGCFITTFGGEGECVTTGACAALGNHTSYPGYCPGPSTVECCTLTPSTSNNPPVPAGWELMMQANVTPAMTTWAVMILDAPVQYPMFSTTMMTFGTLLVMARVEWHPPDFQNGAIHRGVTLYQQVDGG